VACATSKRFELAAVAAENDEDLEAQVVFVVQAATAMLDYPSFGC
jgi:hypothetical protein